MYKEEIGRMIEFKKAAEQYKKTQSESDWIAFEKSFNALTYVVKSYLIDDELFKLIGQIYVIRNFQLAKKNPNIYTQDMISNLNNVLRQFKANKKKKLTGTKS